MSAFIAEHFLDILFWGAIGFVVIGAAIVAVAIAQCHEHERERRGEMEDGD